MDHLLQGLGHRLRGKRRTSRQQVVKNRAERIDVAVRAERAALGVRLFGRHVIGRAKHLPGCRQFGIAFELLGQAKVRDARLIGFIQQHVGRFEVAVQDATLMRIVDRLGDGLDVTGGASGWQRTVAHVFGEVLPLHKIH